jgi:hypothetical protein
VRHLEAARSREITKIPFFRLDGVSNRRLNFSRAFDKCAMGYVMLMAQELTRPIGRYNQPACRNCGRSMHLTRVTPMAGGLPDQRVYSCGECGIGTTETVGDRR